MKLTEKENMLLRVLIADRINTIKNVELNNSKHNKEDIEDVIKMYKTIRDKLKKELDK